MRLCAVHVCMDSDSSSKTALMLTKHILLHNLPGVRKAAARSTDHASRGWRHNVHEGRNRGRQRSNFFTTTTAPQKDETPAPSEKRDSIAPANLLKLARFVPTSSSALMSSRRRATTVALSSVSEDARDPAPGNHPQLEFAPAPCVPMLGDIPPAASSRGGHASRCFCCWKQLGVRQVRS